MAKILHVITGLDNGGAEAVLYRLVITDKENYHVVLSLVDSGVYGERLAARDIPVYTLNMIRGQFNFQSLLQIYRLICKIEPDLIQTWMYHGNLIGGLAAILSRKRAVVWNIRNSELHPERTSSKTRLVAHLCAYLSLFIPNQIICCSKQAAAIHVTIGYKYKKIIIIPNGYNTDTFIPHFNMRLKLRNELGVSPQEILLGMVARWDPDKDHANFIAALGILANRQIPFWRCALVGPNIDKNNHDIVSLLHRHKLYNRVQLLGSRNDIPYLMNAFDIHILSSISEAFPNVVAEAMACGTPSIVTDVGDAAFIVGNTGWVVQPGNASDLANALHQAMLSMSDEREWNERKIACRKRIVKNFSLEKMVKSYNDVWQTVLLQKA